MNNGANIADGSLRDFVEENNPARRQSVIVELRATPVDLPTETVVPGRADRTQSKNTTPQDSSGEQQAMDKLEKDLTGLGLKDLVRLDVASAFVVTVSPEQLRKVSTIPLVGVIRPNREHKIPR